MERRLVLACGMALIKRIFTDFRTQSFVFDKGWNADGADSADFH
jgi:hypothetical protein